MSLAKQFLLLRIPAAREFVGLALLNLFLFVQLIAVLEAFEKKTESKQAASTYYSHQQQVKAVQPDKGADVEKIKCAIILITLAFTIDVPVSVRAEYSPQSFFLSDQCSSHALKGRAPPLA